MARCTIAVIVQHSTPVYYESLRKTNEEYRSAPDSKMTCIINSLKSSTRSCSRRFGFAAGAMKTTVQTDLRTAIIRLTPSGQTSLRVVTNTGEY